MKGQRRCRKGCKVCSRLARLLLSLQAPVGRWMARSLGHQALVKVSFLVLWNKAKFSAYKMQVTVILSIESYKEEKHIRKCWTADALEGAESSCCLMSSLHSPSQVHSISHSGRLSPLEILEHGSGQNLLSCLKCFIAFLSRLYPLPLIRNVLVIRSVLTTTKNPPVGRLQGWHRLR